VPAVVAYFVPIGSGVILRHQQIDQMVRLQRPHIAVLPAADTAPAVVVVACGQAVEIRLRIESDRGQQRTARAMIDVHPHVARLAQVSAQVTIVAVVASPTSI
jgi:hypothetical protein